MISDNFKDHYVYVLYKDAIIEYIGVSCDPHKRFRHHFYEAFNERGKEYKLKKSRWIRKHGENVKMKIVFKGTEKEAYDTEIRLISIARMKNKPLRNNTNGGDRPPKINQLDCFNDIKNKLSEKRRGRRPSSETRLKMSESHKRIRSGDRLGVRKGKENGMAKPVIQMDLDGNFIKEWDCGRTACRALGIWKTGISRAIRGDIKTSGGFRWKYALVA